MLMRIFKLGSHIILFLKNCLNERMFERTEKKKKNLHSIDDSSSILTNYPRSIERNLE